MYFIQFYQMGVISHTPIEACGDRAVIIIDGRQSVWRHHDYAEHECRRRKFIGWRIFAGPAFTRSAPITPLRLLPECSDKVTASVT